MDLKMHLRELGEFARDRWEGLIIGLEGLAAARHHRALLKKLNLSISSEPYYQHRAAAQEFKSLLETRQYDAIAMKFREAFDSKEKNDFGTPLYNIYQRALDPYMLAGGMPQSWTAREHKLLRAMLPLFDAWWDEKRGDPLVGAFCSMAYGSVSALFSQYDRGAANDKLFNQYSERSLDILVECQAPGQDQYLWNCAFYSGYYATQGLPGHSLEERFDRVLAFDPDNIWLYLSHLHYFLDIQDGTKESLEHFARQSMARVRMMPGEEIYARIYQCWVADKYSNRLSETACDWELVKNGYETMLKLYPSQALINYYAVMADEAEDYQLVLDIFRERMTTVVPECWYEYDSKIGQRQAFYTYDVALEELFGDRA